MLEAHSEEERDIWVSGLKAFQEYLSEIEEDEEQKSGMNE